MYATNVGGYGAILVAIVLWYSCNFGKKIMNKREGDGEREEGEAEKEVEEEQ